VAQSVLGSAKTGLIFTRIQEGTQPGELTQPGQTEQGIPYHVPSSWVPVGGSGEAGNSLAAREDTAAVRSGRAAVWVVPFVLCFPLICIVVVVPVAFAVLLNCPYPDPPVSASFFPFSSSPWRREGRPCGSFFAGHSQTITRGDKKAAC